MALTQRDMQVADDVSVRAISTLLEPQGRATGLPARLRENAGIAFLGAKVYGMGFVLDPVEAQEWIAADARNAEVLFPFLNGEDLNSRPDCSPSRWVIDFNDRTEAESAKYELPFARARERVKPERAKLLGRNSSGDDRARNWWKFGRRTPALSRAIADLSEAFAITRVSKTVMPVRVPTGQVLSDSLIAFASAADHSDQAVLSSSLHKVWAITYGSTLETRIRYTPSDVFETFPLPPPTERLDAVGRSLDQERREIMLRRELGLTKLYNLVNDPDVHGDGDIDRMRQIHVEIDEAMVTAYGWQDVRLNHGFHAYRQVDRWGPSPEARTEILDRLLVENHARAANQAGRGSKTSATIPREDGTLLD